MRTRRISALKRLFDIMVATVLLVLTLPIMLGVAAAILATDGSPVFFRQNRMGMHGIPFKLFKFRSMIVTAPNVGSYATSDGDPRITRIGKIIRRTSLDELPQLISVIRGEMSIVGPRPDVEAQVSGYRPEHWKLRCSVRPGITGLAQSRLRSNATPEQRLDLDLEYAREPSLLRDLEIIFATAIGLFGKGVN